MKTILFFHLLLAGVVLGAVEAHLVESKVQTDLDNMLSRIIPRERFLVQVNSLVENTQERRLVEGETTIQSPESSNVVVPPLPGFTSDVSLPRSSPQQQRQVYKMVDTSVLKSLQVQITFDEPLSSELTTQAEALVRGYVGQYEGKAKLNFGRIKMLQGPVGKTGFDLMGQYLLWIPLVTLLLIAGLITFALFRIFSMRPRAQPSYQPSSTLGDFETSQELRTTRVTVPSSPKSLALPSGTSQSKGAYPSLPATEVFVDRRSRLLETFLQNSEIFRLYFARLGEASQQELYAALRGPAFDSLLEGLGLSIPPGGESTVSPSEEQMLFYEKNFGEFIQANEWQNKQFFGFLRQLTPPQLLALLRHENSLVAAVMLKFMQPSCSAELLGALSSRDRVSILSQSGQVGRISTSELLAIEESVRSHIATLPKFVMGAAQEDLDFWSKLLSQAENQEEILLDLEKTRPELYPSLAKFRFKLEDSPSLPKPLLAKVLNEIDNDELAMALLTCPKDVVEFLLSEVNPKRRDLVSTQISMYNGMPLEKTKQAKMNVTRRFREVMA